MKFSITALLALLPLSAWAAPAAQSSNGFPNPSAAQLKQIQNTAGGTLPNTPLPSKLSPAAVQTLQIVAVNELWETFFFGQLLDNVTNSVPGYTDFGGLSKNYVVESLQAILAQEKLHALGVNAILANAGQKTIGQCKYQSPVSNFVEAAALAATFTDLVLGTLQGAQTTFATNGGQQGQELVGLFGSIIGNEAEQNGAYRLIQKKTPSSAPFLTASVGAFAFNAVDQLFIVPNSCSASSNVSAIGAPTFKKLSLSKNQTAKASNSTLSFDTTYSQVSKGNNYIAYISGQNAPVVRPLETVTKNGNTATVSAHFPFGAGFSKGLTIAALVKSGGPFADATAVADATVAGPGLIEVD